MMQCGKISQLSTFLLFVIFTDVLVAQEAVHLVDEVATKRRELLEGYVSVEFSTAKRNNNGNLEVYIQSQYICYFRGNELRMDRVVERVVDGAPFEILRERNILDDKGAYLHYEMPPDGQPVAASVVRDTAAENEVTKAKMGVWDIRLLGLINNNFALYYTYEWDDIFCDQAHRDSLTMEENCILFEDQKLEDRITVAPDKGNLPVLMERRKGNRIYRSEITLKQWGAEGDESCWFPELVIFSKSKDDDDAPYLVNTCRVLEADFQFECDDSQFSMAGLGLDPGWVVVRRPPEPERLARWDGAKLVRYVKPLAATSPPLDAGQTTKLLVAINAFVLIVVGSLLLWRRQKSSSSLPEDSV